MTNRWMATGGRGHITMYENLAGTWTQKTWSNGGNHNTYLVTHQSWVYGRFGLTDRWLVVPHMNSGKLFVFECVNGVWTSDPVHIFEASNSNGYIGVQGVQVSDDFILASDFNTQKAFVFPIKDGVWDSTSAVTVIDQYTSYSGWSNCVLTDSFVIVDGNTQDGSNDKAVFLFKLKKGLSGYDQSSDFMCSDDGKCTCISGYEGDSCEYKI